MHTYCDMQHCTVLYCTSSLCVVGRSMGSSTTRVSLSSSALKRFIWRCCRWTMMSSLWTSTTPTWYVGGGGGEGHGTCAGLPPGGQLMRDGKERVVRLVVLLWSCNFLLPCSGEIEVSSEWFFQLHMYTYQSP